MRFSLSCNHAKVDGATCPQDANARANDRKRGGESAGQQTAFQCIRCTSEKCTTECDRDIQLKPLMNTDDR